MQKINKLVIIGMTNSGKSSLFNFLSQRRIAIVSEFNRTTVDSIKNVIDIDNQRWQIIDSAGFDNQNNQDIIYELATNKALEEVVSADIILLLTEAHRPPLQEEKKLVKFIQKLNKPQILVINKVDNPNDFSRIAEYRQLGIEKIIPISLKNKTGLNELLDLIKQYGKASTRLNNEPKEEINLAIVGRPNAGKSSLFNCLLGNDRSVVSPIAGTTRDFVTENWKLELSNLVMSDTAGKRRKSKNGHLLEFWSIDRTDQKIREADLIILVIDGLDLITRQDQKLAGEAILEGKGVIFAINKWDLAKEKFSKQEAIYYLEKNFGYLPWIKLVFISCLNNTGIDELIRAIKETILNYSRTLQTNDLNNKLLPNLAKLKPLNREHRKPVIKYITQIQSQPPTFVLKGRNTDVLSKQYLKFIEKEIRALADFSGTPIRIKNA